MKLNKILLTLVLSMFVSTGVLASNQDISITIDGVKLHTDVAPKAINNRTMVPMRSIFEAMGAKVEWDNKTSTATGIRGNDTIKLQLGNPKASINGKEIILDVPARAINQRTLVPVRFIAESLGSDVTWDGKTNTVAINNKDNSKPDNEVIKYTDEKYFEFNKETCKITGYKDDGPKDVVIPKSIGGVAVEGIGHRSLSDIELTSVVIPEGVKWIGIYAFSGNQLTSVTIPEGVEWIDEYAFGDNEITKVVVKSKDTSIGHHAFGDNKIISLILPDGIKDVSNGAFIGNELTSLKIPEGTDIISANSFAANKLSSVIIPESVTIIGAYAFGDNQLTSVNIPDGVKIIRQIAFEDNKLIEVSVPKGTIIEEGAFDEGVKIIRR